MNKKIIFTLIASLLIIGLSLLIILYPNTDVLDSKNNSDTLFDVDLYLESQLKDHTFKRGGTYSIGYDQYLVKADYNDWMNSLPLNDPIIKFQFADGVVIDKTITGPANPNTIVIYPTFTSAAYSNPGFYTYFAGACDESCITDLSFANPELKYTSSGMGTQLLRTLGYNFISDVDVDKNPEILKNYDTLILLHNEYVTKEMFNAITAHPNIIFLYPNALYAEIEVNHDDQTMTLIRGHNYPQPEIKNGFDYAIEEEFHKYEYDAECLDWKFSKFENGYALNCYPDAVIWDNPEILGQLKYLTLVD